MSDIYLNIRYKSEQSERKPIFYYESEGNWLSEFCNLYRGFETTCLALYSWKLRFASQIGKMSSRTTGIRTRDLLLTGQMRLPRAALWCSSQGLSQASHPQRRKHDTFPTCLHLLATHTTQEGLRPQTMVGNATFLQILVKLPGWRTLDWRKLTLGVL